MEQGDSTYDLIFTLVDGPPMDLGVDLPDEAKKPIDDAKKSIQTAVDAGSFVISVRKICHESKIRMI